mgnify:CR=1 FL=1
MRGCPFSHVDRVDPSSEVVALKYSSSPLRARSFRVRSTAMTEDFGSAIARPPVAQRWIGSPCLTNATAPALLSLLACASIEPSTGGLGVVGLESRLIT